MSSRKFILTLIALTVFTIALYTTDYTPESIGGGLAMILGVYAAANVTQKIKGLK